MKKKWITIGVLAVLVLGGGYGAYRYFKPKPATVSMVTTKVKTGDVTQTITATGTVNFPTLINLSFPKGGTLVALNVAAGDHVKQGQVLAQLDTSNLTIAVQQAQAKLASDEANLQQVLDNPNGTLLADLSNAQKEVATAQLNYDTAQSNAKPSYLANQVYIAQQNVQAQSNALAAAQQSADSAKIQSAQQTLTQAQTNLQTALQAQNGGAAQALAAAEAAYNQAQADLAAAQAEQARQQQGGQNSAVLSAQAAVAADQANLASAQSDLTDATMTAPTDGVITDVAVQNYQQIAATNTGTQTIMTLAAGNDKLLQIDTAVDQADIDQVKVGQKADITLDSQPNTHISGTVTQIAMQGTTTQNVTTYDVTVKVDAPTTVLHAGMNANVAIISAQAKNVLIVPSEAIRGSGANSGVLVPGPATGNEAQAGQGNRGNSGGQRSGGNGTQNGSSSQPAAGSGQAGASGNRSQAGGSGSRQYAGAAAAMANANVHFVPVQVGLDDGTNAEIISGLTEGQEVVVSIQQSGTAQSSSGGNKSSNPGQQMGQLNRAVGGGFRPPGR